MMNAAFVIDSVPKKRLFFHVTMRFVRYAFVDSALSSIRVRVVGSHFPDLRNMFVIKQQDTCFQQLRAKIFIKRRRPFPIPVIRKSLQRLSSIRTNQSQIIGILPTAAASSFWLRFQTLALSESRQNIHWDRESIVEAGSRVKTVDRSVHHLDH
jgi:hypothetical protein